MAIDRGFCNSLPMSNENKRGTMPKIVVRDVMMIGRRRRRPASCIASSRGVPSRRSSFIASSFKIESLMMIPHVTTIPIALIRFNVCPHSQRTSREAAMSIGNSRRTMRGCTKLSNWAASMKYMSKTDTMRMTTSSPSICRFEKKEPEKSRSQAEPSSPPWRRSCREVSMASGCATL